MATDFSIFNWQILNLRYFIHKKTTFYFLSPVLLDKIKENFIIMLTMIVNFQYNLLRCDVKLNDKAN